MKRAYQSVMIKKKDMTDAENQCVLADIETYNRMKHTALVWNNQNRVFEDERSIHLHLKDRYGCNDYFANSANRKAKALISSQMELREMYLADIHDDIKAIKKKIKKKEKYLKTLTDTKESLVWYTASGCSNPKKIKDCPNVRFMEDGRVRVQVFKKKTFFDNLYLFEHTWLEPKIREVKNNIRQMEHKIGRLGKKARALQEDPLVHVCFGTKKLFHDTRICGEDRVRALHKKRYSRMMVSGRHDSKNGNWVFTYDTQTGDLWYRSMTDWNGKKIRFPGVFFPYGQEQVCSYLNNRAFRFAGLQEDLAIGFHLLAGFANLLHNSLWVLTFLELHVHLEGHKIHRSALYAAGLAGCILHQVGAVSAIHIDFVSLFHFENLLSE